MPFEKLIRHKSPVIDQIPAELIKSEVEQFTLRYTYLLVLFGIKRNFLSSGRSRSFYLFIKRMIKLCCNNNNNNRGISLLSSTHRGLSSILRLV